MKTFTVDASPAPSATPLRPRWKGADAMRLAYDLNERCIELVSELAVTVPATDPLPPCVSRHRDLWSRLSVEARRQLAMLPFVVVDVRFADESWWRALGTGPTAVEECAECLPREHCESVLIETLLFAWQTAREDGRVAQMLFAMTPAVARIMAALGIREIRTLAAEHARLRLRWSEDVRLWRDLLRGASADDPAALEEPRLQAKLLFCGDLVGRLRRED